MLLVPWIIVYIIVIGLWREKNIDGAMWDIVYPLERILSPSKKQNVVARSSSVVEYGSMALATCKLVWIKQPLRELKFCEVEQVKLYCDNKETLHIASNLMFHEKRTKHIKINCYFIMEKLLSKELCTQFICSKYQLVDILTMSLRGPKIKFICYKLATYNLYVLARGVV